MKTILLLIAPFAFLSCSSDSKSDDSVSGFFKKAETAVSSAYAEINTTNSISPTCNNRGEPTSSPLGGPTFARDNAFCVLNQNSQSRDTVQGSFFLVSNIMCAVEKQISFEFIATPTNHNSVRFPENDDCFAPNGFDANGNGNVNDQVLVSLQDIALATTAPYDYFIGLQIGAATYNAQNIPTAQFYLKDSDGVLAARVYQQPNENIFEFVINSNTETFDYEIRNYVNPTFRHIRFSAQGNLSSSSGSFSRVDSASYIFAEGTVSVPGNYAVMMNFSNGVEQYNHYVNNSRAAGYTEIPSISYNTAFYDWSGRSILNEQPLTAPLLNLGVFNMNF